MDPAGDVMMQEEPGGLVKKQPFPAVMQEDPLTGSTAKKLALHRVLNSIQSSRDYGIYVCESFKDPRTSCLDDYWDEVELEAISLDDLHRLIGPVRVPLSDACRAEMNRLSRLLERLSKQIDRIVMYDT